jgi:hypothetical protein
MLLEADLLPAALRGVCSCCRCCCCSSGSCVLPRLLQVLLPTDRLLVLALPLTCLLLLSTAQLAPGSDRLLCAGCCSGC